MKFCNKSIFKINELGISTLDCYWEHCVICGVNVLVNTLHQLSYKCRQLKNAGKIHSTWFLNNSVNVKLDERSQPAKIHHVIDIEKHLGVDNLDEFINDAFLNNLTFDVFCVDHIFFQSHDLAICTVVLGTYDVNKYTQKIQEAM